MPVGEARIRPIASSMFNLPEPFGPIRTFSGPSGKTDIVAPNDSSRSRQILRIRGSAFPGGVRALPGFRGQAKFSSWLYRIALNLCRDWIRRERRTPIVQPPEDVDVMELAAAVEPT